MRFSLQLFFLCALTLGVAADEWQDEFLPLFSSPRKAVEAFWCYGDFGSKLPLAAFSPVALSIYTPPSQALKDAIRFPHEVWENHGPKPRPPAGARCKSDLRNIGTALEMYASDHQGKYPAGLAELAPEYLKTVPKCTTSTSPYGYKRLKGDFLINCTGRHPAELKGYPRYSNAAGLETRDLSQPVPQAVPVLKDVELKFGDARITGDTAVLPVTESFRLNGQLMHVPTEYYTVRKGPGWLIDVAKTAPDLRAELERVIARPKEWPALRDATVRKYGPGKVYLSIYRR